MSNIPQRTIEREIAALQKMSVLQRVGAQRTGKWAIKKDIGIELKYYEFYSLSSKDKSDDTRKHFSRYKVIFS